MKTYVDWYGRPKGSDLATTIAADFDSADARRDLHHATIHIAVYEYEDYSGIAFVIWSKGGKLYEANGSHCSCMGLEGQWAPEETTWRALAMRDWVTREIKDIVKEQTA